MKDDHNKVEICIKEVLEPAVKGNRKTNTKSTKAIVGETFAEYEAPVGSPLHTGNSSERYIIAKANQAFAVYFGCLEGYKSNDYVTISVDILIDDNIRAGHPVSITKKFLKQHDFTYHIKSNKWKTLIFDAARLADRENLGSIVVKVQRTMAKFASNGPGGHWNTEKALCEEEVLTYKFSYDSKARLELLGVIPAKSAHVIQAPAAAEHTITQSPRTTPTEKPASKRKSAVDKLKEVHTPTSITASRPNSMLQDTAADFDAFESPAATMQAHTAGDIHAALRSSDPANEPPLGNHRPRFNPYNTYQSPSYGEAMDARSGFASSITTADRQNNSAIPAGTLASRARDLLDTPFSTGMPPNPYVDTSFGKRKHTVTESFASASDRDDEESQLAKKLRIEDPSLAGTPFPTPFSSSISSYTAGTPNIKVETPAPEDLTELSEVSAEGWSQAKRLQDRAREVELAKRKRDAKKQYELKLAKIQFDYDMEEIEASERLVQG